MFNNNKPYRSLTINLHDVLKIVLNSNKRSYLKYFIAELPSNFCSYEACKDPDIEVYIDNGAPPISPEDIYIEGCFKKIYRYKCLIKGMSDKHTQVYFWGPLWGRFLPMDLAAIFFHNQVLDPIIYYKMLTKRLLMLHASAIGADDEVYLFSGDSGAGKTSLAFRFLNKGYRFLGDDLVFVSSEQKVLSYPKRVHYFSYLKDKNPFLKIPVSKAISAALRESARNILNTLFKEKFYLSTRLHIGSLFPSALYMDKGSLNTIFLLKTDKPISFDDVVFSSDARSFLLDVILKGRKDIAGQTENLERAVLSRIVEKTKIISAAMDEVKI